MKDWWHCSGTFMKFFFSFLMWIRFRSIYGRFEILNFSWFVLWMNIFCLQSEKSIFHLVSVKNFLAQHKTRNLKFHVLVRLKFFVQKLWEEFKFKPEAWFFYTHFMIYHLNYENHMEKVNVTVLNELWVKVFDPKQKRESWVFLISLVCINYLCWKRVIFINYNIKLKKDLKTYEFKWTFYENWGNHF